MLLRDADRMQIGVTLLERTLANQSIDEIAELFNRVFNAIDYQHYPVNNEATCRAILQVLLMGAAMMPSVEVHTAHGRSDLEVTAGSRHWVFEIKFARSKSEVSKLLAEGVAQIKMRQYGERLDNSAKSAPLRAPLTLSRAVLVFSAEERRFEAWAEV